MRKLDLTTPPSTMPENEPAQPVVDPTEQINDNQVSPMKKLNKFLKKPIVMFGIIAILAGVGTGYAANRMVHSNDTGVPKDGVIKRVAEDDVKAGDVFGSADEQTFKDSAQGYLESGGIDGEGSHSLLRPGGKAQTVYLTSSVTDLDKLVGMEVRVWGETFKGQKAGWLMDVGRVEVLNVEGEAQLIE